MLKSAYGEESVSRRSVLDWHKEFKQGRRVSLQDDEGKGNTGRDVFSGFRFVALAM
jgi:hypothetical protein